MMMNMHIPLSRSRFHVCPAPLSTLGFGLASILCVLSQVRMCSCAVVSKRHCFPVIIHHPWLHVLFCNAPPAFGGGVQCSPSLWWRGVMYMFYSGLNNFNVSQSWPVMGFCVHHQSSTASLTVLRCSNLKWRVRGQESIWRGLGLTTKNIDCPCRGSEWLTTPALQI